MTRSTQGPQLIDVSPYILSSPPHTSLFPPSTSHPVLEQRQGEEERPGRVKAMPPTSQMDEDLVQSRVNRRKPRVNKSEGLFRTVYRKGNKLGPRATHFIRLKGIHSIVSVFQDSQRPRTRGRDKKLEKNSKRYYCESTSW